MFRIRLFSETRATEFGGRKSKRLTHVMESKRVMSRWFRGVWKNIGICLQTPQQTGSQTFSPRAAISLI
ncbi:hypothetical protein CHARACLAT_032000 [Characodon lateralis]|uniref:Uncharacterized protein n=1 Tax=Characodon lateralis TaxID=208331 RepID=A0ABU7DLQ5_9TELE|nr:hypothetical protein [Characodon lateralis]